MTHLLRTLARVVIFGFRKGYRHGIQKAEKRANTPISVMLPNGGKQIKDHR